jgi:hypothetical protein
MFSRMLPEKEDRILQDKRDTITQGAQGDLTQIVAIESHVRNRDRRTTRRLAEGRLPGARWRRLPT